MEHPDPGGTVPRLSTQARPWLLRLLALLGAFSFVMLGLTSLLPLLQPTPNDPQRQPQPLPGQPQGRA